MYGDHRLECYYYLLLTFGRCSYIPLFFWRAKNLSRVQNSPFLIKKNEFVEHNYFIILFPKKRNNKDNRLTNSWKIVFKTYKRSSDLNNKRSWIFKVFIYNYRVPVRQRARKLARGKASILESTSYHHLHRPLRKLQFN